MCVMPISAVVWLALQLVAEHEVDIVERQHRASLAAGAGATRALGRACGPSALPRGSDPPRRLAQWQTERFRSLTHRDLNAYTSFGDDLSGVRSRDFSISLAAVRDFVRLPSR